jgi:hypothetical protein
MAGRKTNQLNSMRHWVGLAMLVVVLAVVVLPPQT